MLIVELLIAKFGDGGSFQKTIF